MHSIPLEPVQASHRTGPSWSGDPSTSPRCGAKTRAGTACRAPAVWSSRAGGYTRCRMHGGASTGPKTPEGLAKCRRANWKHGRRSKESIAQHQAMRAELRALRLEVAQVQREMNAWLKHRTPGGGAQNSCLLRLADFSDHQRR